MNTKLKFIFVSFLSLFILIGCRSAPVKNIDDQSIAISSKHTLNDVRKAIVRAGASLGWNMKSAGNGHMIGTLHLRKHVAIVDIQYSKASYSIKYKDSQNLDYDGTNIHSNYNGWISNLNRNIQVQLNTL